MRPRILGTLIVLVLFAAAAVILSRNCRPLDPTIAVPVETEVTGTLGVSTDAVRLPPERREGLRESTTEGNPSNDTLVPDRAQDEGGSFRGTARTSSDRTLAGFSLFFIDGRTGPTT
jgi:hypothetical protein